MPVRDPIGNLCDHMVRVHIRLVESVNFDVLLAVRLAQQVYGRWGIFFNAASLQAVRLEGSEQKYFAKLVTSCDSEGWLGKQDELYELFGVQELSSITAFPAQRFPRTGDDDGVVALAVGVRLLSLPHRVARP